MNKTIIIATHNKGKAKEFKSLFKEYGYGVKTLHDYHEIGEVPETGDTFEENELQKASDIYEELDATVITDDLGLEITGLQGKPRIDCACLNQEQGNDQKNNKILLKELENVNE